MKTKKVLELYAKYYDFLQRLGIILLSETTTIKELGLSKGVIQSGYKEMKELHFRGNLIDYLCLVSTEYMVLQYNKFYKKPSFRSFAEFIVESYQTSDHEDIVNLIRLAMKNPKYLYDLFGSNEVDEKAVKSKMSGFKIIYGLWLEEYLTTISIAMLRQN